MAMFPVNQNVQFFTPTTAEIAELKKTANTSTLLKKDGGKVFFTATSGKHQHTTDPITVKNGGFIKYVAEADMEHTPVRITITYDTNVSSTPVNGEVYGIYINQKGYHTLGERSYMELGAEVRYGSKFNFDANSTLSVTAGEQVINSVKLLMVALAQAFERNLGSDKDLYTIGCTATAVTITEKKQSWLQGLEQSEHLILETSDIHLSSVTINTIDRDDWATVTTPKEFNTSTAYAVGDEVIYQGDIYTTSTAHSAGAWNSSDFTKVADSIVNSEDIADMEWFYLGEHGDTQRLMGYPYANRATISGEIYNIKSNNATGYDLIYIHHAYVGNGTFVQKSEKDIMIAVPADADSNAGGLNIAKAIEAALTGESATLTSAGGMVTF